MLKRSQIIIHADCLSDEAIFEVVRYTCLAQITLVFVYSTKSAKRIVGFQSAATECGLARQMLRRPIPVVEPRDILMEAAKVCSANAGVPTFILSSDDSAKEITVVQQNDLRWRNRSIYVVDVKQLTELLEVLRETHDHLEEKIESVASKISLPEQAKEFFFNMFSLKKITENLPTVSSDNIEDELQISEKITEE